MKVKIFFICITLLLLNEVCKAQFIKPLDSLNLNKLTKINYKLNYDQYMHNYGNTKFNEDAIDMFFFIRKKAHWQSALSLPLGIGGLIAANAIAKNIKSNRTKNLFTTITYVPLIGLGIGFSIIGIRNTIRYTKKHLLQDLILYKKQGIISPRIEENIETDFE